MPIKYLKLLLAFADSVVIIVTGFGVMLLHPIIEIGGSEYPSAIMLFCILFLLIVHKTDLFSIGFFKEPMRESVSIFMVLLLIFSFMVVLFFALKVSINYSRIWAFGWLVSMFVGLSLNRILFKNLAPVISPKKIVVLGAGEQGQQILAASNHPENYEYEVIGLFDDRIERTEKSVAGHTVLGGTKELIEFARANECNNIILAIPWFAVDRISDLMAKLGELSTNVYLAPELVTQRFPVSYSDDLGFPLFHISTKPISDLEALCKRCFDFVLASIALVALSPLLVVVAILIKMDSKGPVFFIQQRYGFNRKQMRMIKFRTMKVASQDNDGELLTQRNDPRITRIGDFLRKSSIDELPQLFNVLTGDMSLVGPRPHATKAKAGNTLYRNAVTTYSRRYRVKPGITGWAQVNGWRGETDTTEKLEKRVEHDLHYIENWSFRLDIVILFRTIWVCITGRNAF